MILKFYKEPKRTKWLGWIENAKGVCIGFVRLDGKITFEW